ncbi:Nucleoporin [Madurella fahalii]|uniref:Nucleoporin n=1 Tax=Madurella fahalii TaxID=1157608 RepID=A0ABQ0GL69_9PEZI
MALARSASGPGGLSINTGSANLFGTSTSQAPAAGGLFGSGAATTQPAQTGSLFGAATSQPQQGGGLFGSTTTQTPAPQPQQTGGLFGQQTTNQPQQQPGGLFGSATTAQQPQQTGGLFGGTTTTQPAQTGGFFGASATQQQQPQATGGLFGASTANTGGMFGKPAASTAGGLFGQTAKPQGGGLFGLSQPAAQPQQQQQQQQQQAQQVGLTMGQSANKQPQVVPGVRIDLSNIKSTTRFNDLQESLQKEIAMIDEAIQKCIQDRDAVEAFLPKHAEQLAAIPTDVSFVTRKSEGANNALSSDVVAIDQLRELVKTDADNARLSFKAIDNLKLPTQYHQAGLWSTRGQQAAASGGSADADAQSNADLISFFSKTADEMDEMMKKFEKNLGEIEVHLHGVQGNMVEQLQRAAAHSRNASQGGVNEQVLELAAVLRDFEESILKVAGAVGSVKEGVTGLQLRDFMGHGS